MLMDLWIVLVKLHEGRSTRASTVLLLDLMHASTNRTEHVMYWK